MLNKTIRILLLLFLILPLFGQGENEIERWRSALIWANYEGITKTSGFFVSKDGIAVIPYHIVGKDVGFIDGLEIWIMTCDRDKVYKAEILSIVSSADLLFIKIDYRPKYYFNEFEPPKEDMQCKVLGFPLRWRIGKDGRVIVNMEGELVGVDIEPFAGASGSVVISLEPDSYGKVLMMGTKMYGYLVGTTSVLIKSHLNKILEKKNGG